MLFLWQMYYLFTDNSFLIISVIVLLLFAYILNKPANLTRDSNKWRVDSNKSLNEKSVPFLSGWTVVLESSQLSRNQIKSLTCFGTDFVLFRGESNKCYAFDAYCPHMGAHLGVGGKVVDESIQCPFHGWTFDRNGQCSHIPGVKGPLDAKLKKYHVIELNGFICVWYDLEENEPGWFPTEYHEINEKRMIFRGKSLNIMNCYPSDILEHCADIQHNHFVHSEHKLLAFRPKNGLIYKWFRKLVLLEFPDVKWTPGHPSSKHTSSHYMAIKVRILGVITLNFHNYAYCMGPCLMNLKTEFNFFGKRKFLTVFGLIQNQQKLCNVILRVYSKSGILNNLLAKHFLDSSCAMFDRDAVILANRKYLTEPVFAQNEESLREYRQWIQQFY